jgi:hypothetical protein
MSGTAAATSSAPAGRNMRFEIVATRPPYQTISRDGVTRMSVL